MSTDYLDSKTGPRWVVGEQVKLWELPDGYRTKAGWVHGTITGVGDDTIEIKWNDLDEPTEYELSNLPNILQD